MSNVKIQGNPAGSGTFTIASPNSNSDVTINLPAVTGGDFIVSNSSGNVGIGTSSPEERLTATATNPTDGRVMSLRNNGSSGLTGTKLWFNQNTVDNWNIGQPAGVNAFVFCNSTGSANERMRIDSAGTLILNQGQIQFPAVQVPSSNANTLDDYEEGTFSPTLSFGGASTGIVYGAANGTYVKVGRLVFVRVGMILSNKGSSTGVANLGNLPFVSVSQSYSDPSAVFNGTTFTSLVAGVTGLVGNNSSSLQLRTNNTTGSAALTNSNFTNTTEFYGSFCYVTDN